MPRNQRLIFQAKIAFFVLGLTVDASGFVAAEDPTGLPTVELLKKASFQRRAGGASQGAVLDAGPAGSWCSGTVGMPTIDFDGTEYRMWFAGDEPTKDPRAPYGIYQRIGLIEAAIP